MRKLVQRFHEWATREPILAVDDAVLGELVYNENSWQCRVDSRAGRIVISIGGRYEPDQRILETGRETFQQIDRFIDRASDYLASETQRKCWQPFVGEIKSLRITDINYWWPHQPEAGMIYFAGPDECRLWHCDVDGANFSGLAFDT